MTLSCLSGLCCLYDFTSDYQLVWPGGTEASFKTYQMMEYHQVASGPHPSPQGVILGCEVQVLGAHEHGPTGHDALDRS